MWCENIIYQLVVSCWLWSNRMRGRWIVPETPHVKVKGSPGAVWCLFSSQWILSHLIVSTQSSQNWITVDFYLWMWITIIALDRRTTPPPSLSFFLFSYTFPFWLYSFLAQMWQHQRVSLTLALFSVLSSFLFLVRYFMPVLHFYH